MKVNQAQSPQSGAPEKIAPAIANTSRADQSLLPAGRSFASVLDSVTDDTSLPPEPAARTNSDTPGSQPPANPPIDRDKPEADVDEFLPMAGVQPGQQIALITELGGDQAPTARQILPALDLDAIAYSARNDLVGGGPQVILDLPRSVLNGLRVTLSADRAGRVSAEFIARNESIRTHLDSRATELVDMMKFRGIDLAEFKTAVSGDPSGQGHAHQQPEFTAEQIAPSRGAAGSNSNAVQPPNIESDPSSRFTYRA